MLRRILIRGVSTALCLLLATVFATIGIAQQKTDTNAAAAQGQPYWMATMQIKPGMEAEFDALLKKELMPALKKAGAQEVGIWKTAVFGRPGGCVVATPIESLADFDQPNPVFKALGQKAATDLFNKMDRLAVTDRMFMVTIRPDLSLETASDYVPKLGLQVTITVAPGRNADYEKNLKGMLAAAKKAKSKGVWGSQVGLGGNPNEYRVLFLFDSFADLEQFSAPFFQAVSEAKLEPQTGIITNIEYAMYASHPELGIQAAAQ